MRVDADADGPQERPAQGSSGHARGGLAGGRALEDVPDVGELVLLGADQVRVARPGQMHLGDRLLDGPRVHPLFPVGVVAVGDLERDRAAQRPAVPDARGDLGAVALDLHAPAAPVAELAAGHVPVQVLLGELQPGGKALYEACQAGAVRLAGGDKSELHGP